MTKHIYIFSSAFSRTAGGIENIAYYMYQLFKELGKQVYAFSVIDNECSMDKQVFVAHGSNALKFIRSSAHFLKLCFQNRKQSNIAIALTWRYGLVPFLGHFFTNVPYVVLCHGNEVLPYEKGLKSWIKKTERKMVLNGAAYICANSQYTKNLVKAITPNKDVVIIHPSSGEIIDRRERDNKGYVLSIGRLEERKGFQFGIEAMDSLKTTFPDLKYYIAGDGSYRKELQALIQKKHLDDRCFLLGRITEEQKRELLDNCAVLVMPSYFCSEQKSVEGFGIVFVEANSRGKPVVGTKSGGIPDAIIDGQTGLLVDEKNIEQLVDSISKLLSKTTVISPGKCYEWAEKHYYKNCLMEYVYLFDRIEKT